MAGSKMGHLDPGAQKGRNGKFWNIWGKELKGLKERRNGCKRSAENYVAFLCKGKYAHLYRV